MAQWFGEGPLNAIYEWGAGQQSFASSWGTQLWFLRSIEKQLCGKADASKSKEARHTFLINYLSSMQSLEEMIALFPLISISSLSLSLSLSVLCLYLAPFIPFCTSFFLCPYSRLYVAWRYKYIPLPRSTPLCSFTFPLPDFSSLPFRWSSVPVHLVRQWQVMHGNNINYWELFHPSSHRRKKHNLCLCGKRAFRSMNARFCILI